MGKTGYVILFLELLLSTSIIFQISVSESVGSYEYLGFAGYVTSQNELEKTVALMESKGLNIYRVSFKPSWEIPEGAVRGYNPAYIDYLLANTDFLVVVDGNHLYPASVGSEYAANNWTEVTNRVFQILQQYPNNSRVAVELINEYTHNDYDTKIQNLINDIRNAGYTNIIVTNKLTTAWFRFEDPLNNTYQGMHFYFNSWDANRAIQQINIATSRGITKILNTELGASSNEYKQYNQTNVDELESFLNQSQALGVNNCIWMNNDTLNWQGYKQYDLNINQPPNPNPTPTIEPTPTETPDPTLTPTPQPTEIPTPTPIPTPTATPTTQPLLFTDSFETQRFNQWTSKGGIGTHSETVENKHPQDGRYNAKFSANSRSESWVYKNLPGTPALYFQEYVRLNNLPTLGNRLYLGVIQANSRNTIEVFIENRAGRYYWGICTTLNGRSYFDKEATASNPQIGTYYAIELCRDTYQDKSKLWIDGTLKVDADRANSGNAYRVYSGITGTNTRAVVYIDNIKVSSSYIGVDESVLHTFQEKPSLVWRQPFSGSAIILINVF